MKNTALAVGFAAALFAAPAFAQTAPAVLFDVGGKFDRSFNQAAFEGAERFKRETGQQYAEFEIRNTAEREQAIRNLARRGASVVVAVGFSNRAAIETVAKEFPDVKFTLIDSVVDLPNVQSVTFREHEGSFLVGMAAAMASKTAKVGFVGGMDIPLIRKFAKGYEEGAKHVNAQIDVIQNMTGTTPAAWNDPGRGSELAKAQMAQGADVIYAAAGGTGTGVLQAAADGNALGVGVDSNQNGLHPGKILTSMMKRVDEAVYQAMTTGDKGAFKPGISNLGLKEGGVDYAMDDNNKALVTDAMKAAVEKAKADIISGAIQVHDYMSDNSCPAS